MCKALGMQVYDIGFSGFVAVLNPCPKIRTWSTRFRAGPRGGLVGLLYDRAAFYDGVYVFEDFDVLEGVGGEGDEVGVVAGG